MHSLTGGPLGGRASAGACISTELSTRLNMASALTRSAQDNPEPSYPQGAGGRRGGGGGHTGVPRQATGRVWADPGLLILPPF